jgi:hypothetical protein
LYDTLVTWGDDTWLDVTTTWDDIQTDVTTAWNDTRTDAEATAEGLSAFVETRFETVTTFLEGLYDRIYSALTSPFQKAWDAIQDLLANWPSLPTFLTPPADDGGETPPASAMGTAQTSGGAYLVGESGPEIVKPPAGSRIWSHADSMGMLVDAMSAALRQGSSNSALSYFGASTGAPAPEMGQGATMLNVNIGPVTVANGMDEARFSAMVRRAVADAL